MSKYTTGEIAKICGVSVRTVQYYDNRGILTPCELSEGGRRLYSEEDLNQMRIICFLREMGFSIDNIGTLFSDGNSEEVITLLIEDQTEHVEKEHRECEEKLNKLHEMKRLLKRFDRISPNSFGDIAHMMNNQRKRKKLLFFMLMIGIVMDIIEVSTLIYGIRTANWIPLWIGLPFVIALGVAISVLYFRRTVFICPHCHTIFRASLRKSFWARHTPNTRRLTCPNCGQTSFCVETYGKEEKKNGNA